LEVGSPSEFTTTFASPVHLPPSFFSLREALNARNLTDIFARSLVPQVERSVHAVFVPSPVVIVDEQPGRSRPPRRRPPCASRSRQAPPSLGNRAPPLSLSPSGNTSSAPSPAMACEPNAGQIPVGCLPPSRSAPLPLVFFILAHRSQPSRSTQNLRPQSDTRAIRLTSLWPTTARHARDPCARPRIH
jgi:hypothetical protein